jgi:hypothetical protein
MLNQTEVVISKGPSEDLDGFIEAMDRLLRISRFFNSRENYAATESTLLLVNSLLSKATKMAEIEFNKMLTALRFILFCLFLNDKSTLIIKLTNRLTKTNDSSPMVTTNLDLPNGSPGILDGQNQYINLIKLVILF